MTDPIDAGSSGAAREALASLIDLHGPALLHEPGRLKRRLDTELPDGRREVELILSSLYGEVPHALLAAHSDEQLRTLFPQLVDRLVQTTGVEPRAATWAVRTWAHALAVVVENERPEGMRRIADHPAVHGEHQAESDRRLPESSTARPTTEDRDAARRSSTAEVLGFGTRPVRQKAPSTVRPPGPIAIPPAAPAAETLVAFDAIHQRPIDAAAIDATRASDGAVPVVATSAAPSTIVSDVAPPVMPEVRTPAPPATRTRAAPRTPTPETPSRPVASTFVQSRRSSSRTFALAAAIAAAVIVVGATLWPAPQSAPTQPAATRAVTTTASASPTPAPTTPPVTPSPVETRSPEPVVVASLPASPTTLASELQPPTGTTAPTETPPPAPRVAVMVTPPVVMEAKPPAAKSAPRVVKPDVAPRKPSSVALVPPKSALPAKVVEAARPTAPPATCTRSTCGSVVSVRPIDDAATRDYEVIVRLDDRTIRTVRMPARWTPGARVRAVGNRFEPVTER